LFDRINDDAGQFLAQSGPAGNPTLADPVLLTQTLDQGAQGGGSAMVVLELAAASTGAGIIPLRHRQPPLEIGILSRSGNHDVGRWSTGSQFPGHELHLWSNMPEERPVALTE